MIPLVIDAARGWRGEVTMFGTDYPTPHGTCIRDYVHVTDSCSAHLCALNRLDQGSVTYNLGNGEGHSVRQVITAVEAVSGLTDPVRNGERRAGDPAVLVAALHRIKAEAAWSPRYAELSDIVRTAYRWQEAHPGGYQDRC